MNFSDLVEKVHRRLLSGSREQFVVLSAPTDAGDGTMSVSGPGVGQLVQGMRIGCDLEMFLVMAATSAGALTVLPAQEGSLPASHDAGTLVTINPRFSRFDCGVAINDDIADLSSPTNGLGQIKTVDFTFNPVYATYDLGSGFDSATSKVLEVSFMEPQPSNMDRLIKRGMYRVVRNSVDPRFPSGNGIVLRTAGFTGLPVHVQFLAPFTPLENLTDDVTGVAGIPQSAADLPALGAEILLVQPREIKRNFTESQPDARKAMEVGPGAVMNSTVALQRQRAARIDAESDRLMRAFPEAEA